MARESKTASATIETNGCARWGLVKRERERNGAKELELGIWRVGLRMRERFWNGHPIYVRWWSQCKQMLELPHLPSQSFAVDSEFKVPNAELGWFKGRQCFHLHFCFSRDLSGIWSGALVWYKFSTNNGAPITEGPTTITSKLLLICNNSLFNFLLTILALF